MTEPGVIQLSRFIDRGVREKMQRNEVLPSVNIILQGSLAGLSGDRRVVERGTGLFRHDGRP